MTPLPTALPGLWQCISPAAQTDDRGSFERLWCGLSAQAGGLRFAPQQWSMARNPRRHTLRGLHWQAEPAGETKLVRLLRGRVFDVVVDMRPASPTHGQWASFVLDAQATGRVPNALLVPPGCAHGYLTLSADTDILYAMDQPHAPAAACGLRWDDPALAIDWPAAPALLSPRDAAWPLLAAPPAAAG